MNNCVAAIDAGTGGVRCVIYDAEGTALSQHYCETNTIYTSDGRAEQDPHELVQSACEAVRGAIFNGSINPSSILGVSVAGVQTTFVPVDADGKYLSNMILWQDMRSATLFPEIRRALNDHGMTEEDLYRRTFRPLDTLAVGGKILWMRSNQPDLYARIAKVINPQAVLLKAFGAEEYTLDHTDTGWFYVHDGNSLALDSRLSEVFAIDPGFFPRLSHPGELMGKVTGSVAEKTGLKPGTPVFQGAVDQCCAALGAGNYGTSSLGTLCMGTAGVLMTYSDEPIPDPLCRYYIIPFAAGGFASELAVPVAASAFRWVRDMLYPANAFSHDGIYHRMDMEAATSPIGADGLIFLPHLAGSIYPRMDTSVRGGYVGFSLSTGRADLVRAALEGIAYGMRQILETGERRFDTLRLLGGASRSDLWNQMQADIYNCPIETIATVEASALGVAMIAATGAGFYNSLSDAVKGMSGIKHRFEPDPASVSRYSQCYQAWLHCTDDLSPRAFPALANIRIQQQ